MVIFCFSLISGASVLVLQMWAVLAPKARSAFLVASRPLPSRAVVILRAMCRKC